MIKLFSTPIRHLCLSLVQTWNSLTFILEFKLFRNLMIKALCQVRFWNCSFKVMSGTLRTGPLTFVSHCLRIQAVSIDGVMDLRLCKTNSLSSYFSSAVFHSLWRSLKQCCQLCSRFFCWKKIFSPGRKASNAELHRNYTAKKAFRYSRQ